MTLNDCRLALLQKRKRLETSTQYRELIEKDIAVLEYAIGQAEFWKKAFQESEKLFDDSFREFLLQHTSMYEAKMSHFERKIGLRPKVCRAIRNLHKTDIDSRLKDSLKWATENLPSKS